MHDTMMSHQTQVYKKEGRKIMLVAVFFVGLVVFMALGLLAGRSIMDSKQFSGADRSTSALAIACTLAAVKIGGIAIVGAAQNGYTTGIAGMWYTVAGCANYFLMILAMKKLYERMPGVSIPQYLKQRYGALNTRIYVIIYLVYAVLYVPMQLKTCVSILQIIVPDFPYLALLALALIMTVVYVGYSGVRGANRVNKYIALGIYVVLIVFAFSAASRFGGIKGVAASLPATYSDPFQMSTLNILNYAFGTALTFFGFQSFMQPLLSASSVKTARRGLLIGWFLSAPICVITAFIGMIARVGAGDSLGNGSTAFAWAVKAYASPVFAGLIFAVVFMIIAATLSGMFVGVSVFVHYLWVEFRPNTKEETLLKVDRLSIYIFALLTIIPTLLIPSADITRVFTNMGYCVLVPISFAILGGVFWDRVTQRSALISHLSGIACALIWVALGLAVKIPPAYPVAIVTWAVGVMATLLEKPVKTSGIKTATQ